MSTPIEQALYGHVIDQIYTSSEGSVYVLSTINDYNGSTQKVFLSRSSDSALSNLIFSKLIFQRPLDDAQFGADTGAKFLGEDDNGIILVTGGSNITHQTNSSVYTVNPLGDIIDQKYAGTGSSGAIKLGNNIVNVDHGDAHFFASNGDSNEVTIRLIPDPNGTSTGGHLLKSYYTVNYPHGAMPPDIDIHAAKNGGYIISAVNRGSDRLISVENYDLDSTHSDSFILEGGLSQGSFEVDKEGPIIFKVDGHSNKGDLNIKLSGYPNGTYSSRNLNGDGNFSSTDGLNDWVYITDLQPTEGKWNYEVLAADSTNYGYTGLKPEVTVINAESLSYYTEKTLLEYYNNDHTLMKTVDIGAVQDPQIISKDDYDYVFGNERISGPDVRTCIKKINNSTGEIEWSKFLKNEPSKITDLIFTDDGDLLVGGIEYQQPSNKIFTNKISLEDGLITAGPIAEYTSNSNASVSFHVDQSTAVLKSIVSDASGEIFISNSDSYFSLNSSHPEKNNYKFNKSVFEDFDATEGKVLFSSSFLDRYFSDADGDKLFYSFVDGPEFIYLQDGEYFMPFDDHTVGVHKITMMVSDRDPNLNDPLMKSIFHDYNIEVNNYPEAPTSYEMPDVNLETGYYYRNILGHHHLGDYFDDDDFVSNPDERLIFSVDHLPEGLTLNIYNGIISGTVENNQISTNVAVTATDIYGKSASTDFKINFPYLQGGERSVWESLGSPTSEYAVERIDAPDIYDPSSNFKLNAGDTIHGLLDSSATVDPNATIGSYYGDQDFYDLGILAPGIYNIEVSQIVWTELLDNSSWINRSYLYEVDNDLNLTPFYNDDNLEIVGDMGPFNIDFELNAPTDLALGIIGGKSANSPGDAQYFASLKKMGDVENSEAAFTNPLFSIADNDTDNTPEVGKTLKFDINILDPNLQDNTTDDFKVLWYSSTNLLDDTEGSNYLGEGETLLLTEKLAGKYIYAQAEFTDSLGVVEASEKFLFSEIIMGPPQLDIYYENSINFGEDVGNRIAFTVFDPARSGQTVTVEYSKNYEYYGFSGTTHQSDHVIDVNLDSSGLGASDFIADFATYYFDDYSINGSYLDSDNQTTLGTAEFQDSQLMNRFTELKFDEPITPYSGSINFDGNIFPEISSSSKYAIESIGYLNGLSTQDPESTLDPYLNFGESFDGAHVGDYIFNADGSYKFTFDERDEKNFDSYTSGSNYDAFYITVSDGDKSEKSFLKFIMEFQNDPPTLNENYNNLVLFEGSPTFLLSGQRYTHLDNAITDKWNSNTHLIFDDSEITDISFSAANEESDEVAGVFRGDGLILGQDKVGLHDINIQINDADSSIYNFSIELEVQNKNDKPVILSPSSIQLDEGEFFSHTFEVSDADIETNYVTSIQGLPSWLSYDSETMTVSGTASNSDVGSKNIVFNLTDETGDPVPDLYGNIYFHNNSFKHEISQVYNILVNNKNDPPEFNFTPPSNTEEDIAFKFQLTANDPDAEVIEETLTFEGTDIPEWLSVSSDGLITGTPADKDVGTHLLTVKVTDSSGETGLKTFALTVDNVNDTPTFHYADISLGSFDQEKIFSIPLYSMVSDDDFSVSSNNEYLRYSKIDGPGWLVVSPDGQLLGMATNEYIGSHPVTLRVTDNSGASDTKTFTLTINNINDAPVLESIPNSSTDEDALFEYQLTATDIDMDAVDNETLTFEAVTTPDWMAVSSTGLITGTPENNDVGDHTITVKVIDSAGESDTKTFSLLVNNTNDAPVLESIPNSSTDEDAPFEYQLTATDIDMDVVVVDETLTFEAVTTPDWMSVSSSGLITGTPENDDVDAHTVTVKVTDSFGESDTKTFTLTVNNTNDAPEFDPSDLVTNIDQGDAYSYNWASSDPDIDDGNEIKGIVLPDWLSLTEGTMYGTPTNSDVGSHEIYITVTDEAGASDYWSDTIVVNNVNDAPVLESIPNSSTDEDVAFEYQLTATDIDMDVVDDETLTFEAVTTPDWMSISSSGLITGMPENFDVGEHSITVKVSDSVGESDTKTFTLTVNNTNDAPVIKIDDTDGVLADAIDGSVFSHKLGVADVDVGDTHTYTMSSAEDISWLHLDTMTGQLTGTPDDVQVGVYNITFSVEDAAGVASVSDAISLTVQNVNDPVYIDEGQSVSFKADKEGIYQIAISDEDLADSYTFTADNLPDWLSLDPVTGILTGTPTRADDGVYTIDVTVTDGGGLSDTDTISIKSTSYQYASLGSGADFFMGENVQDHISTGGGDDKIMSAGGDDVVVVQGQGDVEVDTGEGDDRVIVEDGWSGTLLVKNGSGSNILEIGGNQENFDVDIVDDQVQLILNNGSTITIDEQHSLDTQTGLVEISDKGFEYIKIDGYDDQGLLHEGEDAYSTYIVLGSNDANYLVASQPDDAESNDEVYVGAGDGADIIEASAHNAIIEGDKGDDTIRISATSGKKFVFGDIFNGDSGNIISSQNSSYADVVEIAWGYDASTIEQVAHGYRITNSVLDAVVEVYDVEVLKFATGDTDNPWDIKYLTAGAPVGKDNWMNGHANKDIAYGDGSDVRFVLGDGTAPEGAAASSNDTSDILQVYANVTTVTQETYVYYQRGKVIRTTPARGYAKKTGTRDVESTEEALIWEGDRTSVDAFNFSDGVSINVINVADTTWSGEPIYSTIGTEGVDIIFGNDSDNLIDGKGGDDIIFGGDGDDVIIGGEGDDILVGGAGDDTIRGDMVDEMDAAREYFAGLDGFDASTLSIETSTVVEGNDVILGGDGVDDIESGEGKNVVASGRADMDGDGEADLDTIKEHMTTNKDIFDDDDWI